MTVESDAGFDYDVCLSFAGEQRAYVDELAAVLKNGGVRVFYDDYERAQLWGKDLYEHLDFVYRQAARYCVLFVSEDYSKKLWTSHERQSAQARAFEENAEYILPVRFDDTDVPGLRPTVGYIRAADTGPEDLAELIRQKLGPRQRDNFYPPHPDGLLEHLGVSDADEREMVEHVAYKFFQSLQRMTHDERLVVHAAFMHGCPVELPENVHISLDLLRRTVDLPASQVLEILGAISSLGFRTSLRDETDDEHELTADDRMVVLNWSHRTSVEYWKPTSVAHAIVWTAASRCCLEHATEAFVRLDFSALGSATADGRCHE